MISMIKGIPVTLHVKTQTGTDGFGRPIYTDTLVSVENVLVGEPSTEDIVSEIELNGKRLAYTLGIPKGDEHDWSDTVVEFFGGQFKTYGDVTQGIEAMLPLAWNKKVKVERYG